MKFAIRQLPRVLDTHGVSLQDRSYVLALGLARAIAYQLPIPSSPVDIPLSFFALQYLGQVNDVLSEVNEQIVINIELATSLVKKLWLLRYNVVFEMENATVRHLLDETIAGGSTEIPPHASEICRKFYNQGLFGELCDVVKEAYSGEPIAC